MEICLVMCWWFENKIEGNSDEAQFWLSEHVCTGAQNPQISWLVGWVYGISTFVDYLMPNPFLYK